MTEIGSSMKHCLTSGCNGMEFGLNRNRRDGRNAYCKACALAKTRERRVEMKRLGIKLDASFRAQRAVVMNVGSAISTEEREVSRVLTAIQGGAITQRAIAEQLKLSFDTLGEALVVLFERKQIRTRGECYERIYFARAA